MNNHYLKLELISIFEDKIKTTINCVWGQS
jgi:hypothetical protein